MAIFWNPKEYKNHKRPHPAQRNRPGPVKHGGMTIAIPAGNRVRPEQQPKRPLDRQEPHR